jgi:hypothetical protein
MMSLHPGATEFPADFKDPYYYIVVGLTWMCWITAIVVGIALLMGWLPGLR